MEGFACAEGVLGLLQRLPQAKKDVWQLVAVGFVVCLCRLGMSVLHQQVCEDCAIRVLVNLQFGCCGRHCGIQPDAVGIACCVLVMPVGY